MRTVLFAALAGFLVIGCSGADSELPKDQDKELRNNFKRKMSDEEIAKMRQGAKKGEAPPGASSAPAGAPQ